MNNLLDFVNTRITELTRIREEDRATGDFSTDDYCSGAIDAYDIVRMKLEDMNA